MEREKAKEKADNNMKELKMRAKQLKKDKKISN